VTYGGVDASAFRHYRPATPKEPLKLAYIGRLEPDTGLLALFASLESLDDVPLVVSFFGEGSLKAAATVLSGRVSGKISVRVGPPTSDVHSVLASHDVILASGYLTILEALNARRFVVAFYDNPLRRDYLAMHPAAEAMWRCGGAEDFTASLRELRSMRTDELHARYQTAWDWASEQDWGRVAGQYVDLWRGRG
jgi:hypothetical protein